jgi:hypothetical protein
VLAVREVDGEVEVVSDGVPSRCPRCGMIAPLHDRRETLVREVDALIGCPSEIPPRFKQRSLRDPGPRQSKPT